MSQISPMINHFSFRKIRCISNAYANITFKSTIQNVVHTLLNTSLQMIVLWGIVCYHIQCMPARYNLELNQCVIINMNTFLSPRSVGQNPSMCRIICSLVNDCRYCFHMVLCLWVVFIMDKNRHFGVNLWIS